MELSSSDRRVLTQEVGELDTNSDQLAILVKKIMDCKRTNDPAYLKIENILVLWRRHRGLPHLFSREYFQRELKELCATFLNEDQQQQQQLPQPQQPVAQGGGSGSNAQHVGGGGGGGGGSGNNNDPAQSDQSTRRRSDRFARAPVAASGARGGGGGGSSSGSRRGRVVSPGQEKENGHDDDDDDMEQDQNGGSGGSMGAPAEEEYDINNDDDDGTMEAKVKRFVDAHIESGFLEQRRWKPTEPFVRPGDGYWDDTHDFEEFRTSTDEDLRVAQPVRAPVYIAKNPLCGKTPKHTYDRQRLMYYLCKKVAVSKDGVIFRATDKEIEDALKKEAKSKKFLKNMRAGTYVKVIQEARRRHRISEEKDQAALVEPEEDENEDEGEEHGERGAESARAGKRILRVPPGEDEQEEEEEEDEEDEEDEEEGDGESDDDDDDDDDYDNNTVIQLDQNGDSAGDNDTRDISDANDDDDAAAAAADDDDAAEQEIKKLVDTYEAEGFFQLHRWRPLNDFKSPGEGYWRDKHGIIGFRTSTDADLKVARPAPAPVYIPFNPMSKDFPKGMYRKQLGLYHQCKKVAVTKDGVVFRATDKEIEAALKKVPEEKNFMHGMKAETYVKMVCEVRRRHRIFRETGAKECAQALKRRRVDSHC